MKSLDNLDIRKTILNQVSEQLFSNAIATTHNSWGISQNNLATVKLWPSKQLGGPSNSLKHPSNHLEYPNNHPKHSSNLNSHPENPSNHKNSLATAWIP